ncbi:hypothetical protein PS2_010423 [Malus domestica]
MTFILKGEVSYITAFTNNPRRHKTSATKIPGGAKNKAFSYQRSTSIDCSVITLNQKSRKYLQPNRWLQSWWRREIQALMQEEDVDIIMHQIHGVINSSLTRDEQKGRTTAPEEKQREFQESTCDAAGPFLAARTNRFVNDVELFLASDLKIEAYDAVCVQRLGWSAPGVTTEPAEVELAEHRPVIP